MAMGQTGCRERNRAETLQRVVGRFTREKLRVVTRCFTKVRTDQARNSAMFGFPSPPQVRCPKWVVRLRETWSHCYGWEQFLDANSTNEREFKKEQKAFL